MSNPNKVIWKYPLPYGQRHVEIFLPLGAEPLSVAVQEIGENKIVLWALVDPEAPVELCRIAVEITGGAPRPLDKKYYLGSVILESRFGVEVLHVFFFGNKVIRYD